MKLDIVRAWKDEAYRESLSQEQKELLPANPAGELEMSDAELAAVVGAGGYGYDGDCYDDPCYDPCSFSGRRSRRRHHHYSGGAYGFDGDRCGFDPRGGCHHSWGFSLGGEFGFPGDC
jgi:mersacidin/lichenicidin family type 2 lantibiotic